MRDLLTVAFAFAMAAIGSGCTSPPRTTMLHNTESPQPSYDDQYTLDEDNTVFITFSGGGMRAAALAYGVLKELKAQKLESEDGSNNKQDNPKRLIDEIDLVSSVSGGSVTAAYWALKGSDEFDWTPENSNNSEGHKEHFVEYFLQRDIQTPMIAKGILTLPWTLFVGLGYNRINLLVEHLEDEKLFGDATFGTLIHPILGKGGEGLTNHIKRPHLIINATDMETGYVFSFTQDQFDLICADLTKMRLADAVAASAAYPIFLSALTLENHSPCDAQELMARKKIRKWHIDVEGNARPNLIAKYLNTPYDRSPREVLRARRALEFLTPDKEGENRYVHLLDGGIVDNLGLSLPLTLFAEKHASQDSTHTVPIWVPLSNLWTIGLRGDDPEDQNLENERHNRICAIILVNARSQPDRDYENSSMPPGIDSTLFSTFGAAVDSTSLLLTDKAVSLPGAYKCVGVDGEAGVTIIRVDFDSIPDEYRDCRKDFHNISTSWSLSEGEVNALIKIGGALLRESHGYSELVGKLGGAMNGAKADGQQIQGACQILQQDRIGQ